MSLVIDKEITWTFRTYDTGGSLFRPTTVTLTVTKGNGISVGVALSEQSTGVYTGTITPSNGEEGLWSWAMVFTDALSNQETLRDRFYVA